MSENQPDESLLDMGSDYDDPVDDVDVEGSTVESYTNDDNELENRHKVRKAVRDWGENGITVKEIEEITGLADKTIRNHLDTLRRLREVYRIKRNQKLQLWYPNGKPLHSFGKRRIGEDEGESTLELQLAEGKNEEYLFHLTEKRFSLVEGETTEGAITFPVEYTDALIEQLQDMASEVES